MIHIKDKTFKKLISHDRIQKAVGKLARKINKDFKHTRPVFVCVLNGSFLFAAALVKLLKLDCDITFVKVSSYEGTRSSGKVKVLIGLDENLRGRKVIILEDIVDTGNTIESVIKQIKAYQPRSIKIATLLFKPDAYSKKHKIDYIALRVPDKFLVGYGLDYDGLGRNLNDIYSL